MTVCQIRTHSPITRSLILAMFWVARGTEPGNEGDHRADRDGADFWVDGSGNEGGEGKRTVSARRPGFEREVGRLARPPERYGANGMIVGMT